MYGAIIGDIAGSAYEFNPVKDKDFQIFVKGSRITDDSVMTSAVADALMTGDPSGSPEDFKKILVSKMQEWGRRYPEAGYGGRFGIWLLSSNPKPYNSFGNGSAMRVSPVGWIFDDLETTIKMAALTAAVTHDHHEGIKGAEATAAAIFMARNSASKDEIRKYVEKTLGYDLKRTCDEIRPSYSFDVTCQGSVPEAIIAFLDGKDYEDCIRSAISLGGDADTQAAIAGSIAEAYYGIPDELINSSKSFIPEDMQVVIDSFLDNI